MSESFHERLSRFTPDAGKLDRDSLLFNAGRRSARPNRVWKSLASLLAGSQVLSLILLWPHAMPPSGLTVAGATAPVPPATSEPRDSEASEDSRLWSARHRLLESETEDRPAADMTFIDRMAPLRASGARFSSLLN